MRLLISRPLGRAARWLAAVLLCAGLATAAAQVCLEEIHGALLDSQLERPATGVDAALALKRAVDLVEPALPRLRTGGSVPLAEDHPAYPAVKFLQDRRLLAPNWTPDALDEQTWRAMLSAFLAWYKLDGPLPDAPGSAADVVNDVALVLGEVSSAIRPAALLASDPDNGDRLSFWAIIWNWTVYPRLLVVRPLDGVELGRDPRAVLPNLSNCAVKVDRYISAPQERAKSLFLTHNDSRMYVVASEPQAGGAWPLEVEPGAELQAFDFTLPELDGVRVYAAVFDGPEIGIGRILGLMTSVRTNLSPTGFISHMQTP